MTTPQHAPRPPRPAGGGRAANTAAEATTTEIAWVWTAMEPAERRRRLLEMRTWVNWLINDYPSLRTVIPPCWHQHREGRNRLTALYVGWVRTYVEADDKQRDLALVEWHDALDRHRDRLHFPTRCVTDGAHRPESIDPWDTEDGFAAWLANASQATCAPHHPARQFAPPTTPTRPATRTSTSSTAAAPSAVPTPRPVPSPPSPSPDGSAASGERSGLEAGRSFPGSDSEARMPAAPMPVNFADVMTGERMAQLIEQGHARPLSWSSSSGVVRYRDAWWCGSRAGMLTRIKPDDPVNAELDDRDARQALADQAVAQRQNGDAPHGADHARGSSSARDGTRDQNAPEGTVDDSRAKEERP